MVDILNWIEIDKILCNILERHDSVEDAYAEAEKQFKWNRTQSKSAIDPLLKRHSFTKVVAQKPKTRSKRSTKRNKSV
jgi:hypothetical protein